MRTCNVCHVSKPWSDFHKEARNSSGYKYTCKTCRNARLKDTRNADMLRSKNLHNKYGLTEQQYNELVLVQCGLCAVCGNPETRVAKNGQPHRLAVHHDHVTGRVIALLCSPCNRGIGLLKDSSELLSRAADLQRLST